MTNLPAHKRKNPPPAKTQSNNSGITSTLIDGIMFGAGSSIGHSIINKISGFFFYLKMTNVQKFYTISINVRKIITMIVWKFFLIMKKIVEKVIQILHLLTFQTPIFKKNLK